MDLTAFNMKFVISLDYQFHMIVRSILKTSPIHSLSLQYREAVKPKSMTYSHLTLIFPKIIADVP